MADDYRTFMRSYVLLLLGVIAVQNVGWETIDSLVRAFAFHPLGPLVMTTDPLRAGATTFFLVAGMIAILIGSVGCAKSVYDAVESRFGTGSGE
ncbi:hypothetical protein [Halorussus ruber]|uniref:hypothetical protein n=1 Tax=Halorussus ruber TaxID=1126238 RepID=UPI001092CE21|nr:hypothetical protein [Halorussus ruber]